MPERKRQIAVLGAGAWGTVLANLAARNEARVTLWARDAGHAAEMAATGVNARRLPGVPLASNVTPTDFLPWRPRPTSSCSRCRPRRCARFARPC